VAIVRTTLVVPLPAGTCAELSEQVLATGQPMNFRATGLGNVPEDGVTLKSYVAVCPAVTVCAPEVLAIEKLKPPVTVTERF
jgi:hypothetical protein